jgi:hypothetical protein
MATAFACCEWLKLACVDRYPMAAFQSFLDVTQQVIRVLRVWKEGNWLPVNDPLIFGLGRDAFLPKVTFYRDSIVTNTRAVR